MIINTVSFFLYNVTIHVAVIQHNYTCMRFYLHSLMQHFVSGFCLIVYTFPRNVYFSVIQPVMDDLSHINILV